MDYLDIDDAGGQFPQADWLRLLIAEAKADLIPQLKLLKECKDAYLASQDVAEKQGNRLFGLLLAAGMGDAEAMREVKECQKSIMPK